MRQRRITYYFPPKNARLPKECHFFRLPYAVRRMIYIYAGVPVDRLIELNYWNRYWQECDEAEERGEIAKPNAYHCYPQYFHENGDNRRSLYKTTISLSLVSSVVYDDTVKIFYGENRFSVVQRGPGGLQALQVLGPRALQQLNYLYVHLTPCRCHEHQCAQIDIYYSILDFWNEIDPKHERVLQAVSRTDNALLAQWKQICTRVAAHIISGQLRFFLMCMTKDIAIAKQIAKPLSALPILKSCSISLSSCKNVEVQDLVMTTVKAALGKSPAPFRLFDLPREIQLNILEHTALVAPAVLSHQIHSQHSHIYSRNLQRQLRADFPDKEDSTITSMAPNWYCAREFMPVGIYCSCYSYPLNYFLVSKEFGEMALKIFYSKNHFHFKDIYLPHNSQNYSLDHIPCSSAVLTFPTSYLLRLPESRLQTLTRLAFVFPPITSRPLSRISTYIWGNWSEVIEKLSAKANLPALTLEVHMSQGALISPSSMKLRQTINPVYEEEMRKFYCTLLTPLKALHNLKALFVYLTWPAHETRQQIRREDERTFEKMVLGPDFEASRHGKEPESPHINRTPVEAEPPW